MYLATAVVLIILSVQGGQQCTAKAAKIDQRMSLFFYLLIGVGVGTSTASGVCLGEVVPTQTNTLPMPNSQHLAQISSWKMPVLVGLGGFCGVSFSAAVGVPFVSHCRDAQRRCWR